MTVYLVGAGPGDPGLMTVRGAEVLRRADAVVHDRLAEASLLDLAPATAERIDVGKAPGGPVRQDDINLLLVELAREGKEVVRLKGGDPFVFGRGGEEALALQAAGIPFEVVPGITSAVAVLAYAGIPITHRGLSASFTVVTGHSRHEPERPVDWDALARAGDTIVVLMGVAHRAEIGERLMAAGRPGTTPVAAVQWGTRPQQRTTRTTLAGLAAADVEPPATLVIGEVASLDVRWFEDRPLLGRRVVVTRTPEQAGPLSDRLRALGAEVLEVPLIRIANPADGGESLASAARSAPTAAWVVFTSANAVDRFCALLRDARGFGTAKVAAIGPGTAAALARFGVVADLVPERSVAEGLLEAFPAGEGWVVLPQAADARTVLADGLARLGWTVELAEAYRTEAARLEPAMVERIRHADVLTLTSGSTARSFVGLLGFDVAPPKVVAIGPIAAEAASSEGMTVAAVADPHTIDGLVDAVVAACDV